MCRSPQKAKLFESQRTALGECLRLFEQYYSIAVHGSKRSNTSVARVPVPLLVLPAKV
jgi:hypothetical protein